jgi:hypothetical protein
MELRVAIVTGHFSVGQDVEMEDNDFDAPDLVLL